MSDEQDGYESYEQGHDNPVEGHYDDYEGTHDNYEFDKTEKNWRHWKKIKTVKKMRLDATKSQLLRDFRPEQSRPVQNIEEDLDLLDLNAWSDDVAEKEKLDESERPLPTWSVSDTDAEKRVLSMIRKFLCFESVTVNQLYPMVISEIENLNLHSLDITNPKLYEFKDVKDLEDYMRARSLLFRADTQTNLWSNLPLGYGMHVSMLANYILRKSSDWIPVDTIVRQFGNQMALGQVEDWRDTDEKRLVLEEVENKPTRETLIYLIKQHPRIFEIRESTEIDGEYDISVSEEARHISSIISLAAHPDLPGDRLDKSRIYKYEAVIGDKVTKHYAKGQVISEPYVGKSVVIYSNDIKDEEQPWQNKPGNRIAKGKKVYGHMHPTADVANDFRACSVECFDELPEDSMYRNPRLHFDMEAIDINIDELDFIREVRRIIEGSDTPTLLGDLRIKLNKLKVASLRCESDEFLYEYLDLRREFYEIIEEKEATLPEYEVRVIITPEEIDEYLCPNIDGWDRNL